MSAIVALFVGGTITLLVNVALQRWKYGREAIDKRCDEIEKAALELGVACRDYWLKLWPAPNGPAVVGPTPDDLEFAALHSRIVGLSQRIQGLNAIVLADFEGHQQLAVLQLLATVLDQATGGQFEVKHRQRDFDRARGVEAACADYTVMLRQIATSRWHWSAAFLKTKRRVEPHWSRSKGFVSRYTNLAAEKVKGLLPVR